ncbi:hypothetical protein L7F22_029607 [Adiantum nelumboides]|nr:hypothetical protein [Adiantum nelumboides]
MLSKDLTEEDKQAYLTMLEDFPRLLIKGYDQVTGVTVMQHHITLKKGSKPTVQWLQRLGVIQQDALLAEVRKLLNARFIYPVEDLEWVSPVVVTSKKNGKWRVCVGYKPLNTATKRDHFPLPFQDEILNEVAGYERYTVCDGYSGQSRDLTVPSAKSWKDLPDFWTICVSISVQLQLVDKRNLLHSRQRLHHLTKAAVDKACKLHVESRRLVHIVDTQSCGSLKGLGLSNSLPSFMKKSSPQPSRQWALPKGSDDRCTVAARIHALLVEWKADSSFEWKAKVASAVPVLEEALYKGAKSKEEYSNPQLLESQLIHVLCHFEAAPLARMSLFQDYMLGHGISTTESICELAPEQPCERARLSRPESSSTVSSTNSDKVLSNIEDEMHPGLVDCKEMNHQNHGAHASDGFVKKVANILAKKKRENSVCLLQELRRANSGSEGAEDIAEDCQGNVYNCVSDTLWSDQASSCSRHERTTLGGILQLNMFKESTIRGVVMVDKEAFSRARSRSNQGAGSMEGHPPPSNIYTETSSGMFNKFPADFIERHSNMDSGMSEGSSSSLISYDEGSNVSDTGRAALECGAIDDPLSNKKIGARYGQRSLNLPFSSSSSSCMPIAFSSPTSSSSLTPLLSTSALPSHLFSQSLAGVSPILPSLSLSAPNASASSPLQQQQARYQSQCQPQQIVSLSTALEVESVELRHSQPHIAGEPNDYNAQSELSQAFLTAEGPAIQAELQQQAATETVSEQHAEASRATFLLNSSPLANNEVLSSRVKGRGLKLPLRRFLAEREEYKGSVSGYVDGGCPWETWDEATEQLDGMCCVCMAAGYRAVGSAGHPDPLLLGYGGSQCPPSAPQAARGAQVLLSGCWPPPSPQFRMHTAVYVPPSPRFLSSCPVGTSQQQLHMTGGGWAAAKTPSPRWAEFAEPSLGVAWPSGGGGWRHFGG